MFGDCSLAITVNQVTSSSQALCVCNLLRLNMILFLKIFLYYLLFSRCLPLNFFNRFDNLFPLMGLCIFFLSLILLAPFTFFYLTLFESSLSCSETIVPCCSLYRPRLTMFFTSRTSQWYVVAVCCKREFCSFWCHVLQFSTSSQGDPNFSFPSWFRST